MAVENYIFWSEIGTGSEEAGGTPPPRILRSIPPPGFEAALLKSELVGHADHLENETGFFLKLSRKTHHWPAYSSYLIIPVL